jgi:hypothetical protein
MTVAVSVIGAAAPPIPPIAPAIVVVVLAIASSGIEITAKPPVASILVSLIAEMIVIVPIAVSSSVIAPITVRAVVAAALVIEMTPATFAEHSARARVRIEPDDPSVGRHPFQPIMKLTIATHEWTFGVVEPARMRSSNLRKQPVERQRASGAGPILRAPIVVILRLSGSKRQRHNQGDQRAKEHASTHLSLLVRYE